MAKRLGCPIGVGIPGGIPPKGNAGGVPVGGAGGKRRGQRPSRTRSNSADANLSIQELFRLLQAEVGAGRH